MIPIRGLRAAVPPCPATPKLRRSYAPSATAIHRVLWTPEQDTRLRNLWAEGLPARAIGDVMGISKNSAIGRAHRLNLPRRPNPVLA